MMKLSQWGVAAALVAVLAGGTHSPANAQPAANSTRSGSALIDQIKKQEVVRIAVSAAPPNIIQAPSGDWEGVFPDIVKYIGEKLGARVDFTKVPFSGMIAGIQSERYDLALVQAITDERQKSVNFTDPVSYNVGAFYVNKNKNKATRWADLNKPDQTICTARGTIWDTELKKLNPQAQTLLLTSWEECLSAMQAGRATTVLFGWNEVTTLAPKLPEFGLVFTDEPLGLAPLAFVISKKYSKADIAPVNQLIAEWAKDSSRLKKSLQKAGVVNTPLAYAVGTVPQYAKDAVAKSVFGSL